MAAIGMKATDVRCFIKDAQLIVHLTREVDGETVDHLDVVVPLHLRERFQQWTNLDGIAYPHFETPHA